MKITRNGFNIPLLQKPNKLQQETKTQKERSTTKFQGQAVETRRAQSRERVQISNRFREVMNLKKQIMTQASPLRKEKVAQVKAAIAKGTYRVNAKGTAVKLLQNTIINNIYSK